MTTKLLGIKTFSFLVFLLTISTSFNVLAADRCLKYVQEVRRAHFYYFGLDFPYWYSVAQLAVESQCRNVTSKDGIGSYGLAQITWRWWKDYLRREGIPHLKTTKNQLWAQAAILKYYYRRTSRYCKELYVMYQCYNRSCSKVIKENKGHCDWYIGYLICEPQKICVWRKGGECLQWRNSCDINYNYSRKIYKIGNKYTIDSEQFYFFGEVYVYPSVSY